MGSHILVNLKTAALSGLLDVELILLSVIVVVVVVVLAVLLLALTAGETCCYIASGIAGL